MKLCEGQGAKCGEVTEVLTEGSVCNLLIICLTVYVYTKQHMRKVIYHFFLLDLKCNAS